MNKSNMTCLFALSSISIRLAAREQENKCALLKIVHEKHDNIRNTFHPLIYFAFK